MADGGSISLSEFKARLPLVEIVARHVRLTRRGREHIGLCPFHQEKTPSFTVSESKGFYHCFGCGQHGNAIDFVMALEGLDFPQAVGRLAELTGIPAPRATSSPTPAVDRTLYAVNEAAARWFAGRLESAEGKAAADYLAGRGLDRAAIERFGLGYAPREGAGLKRAMIAEGYAEAQLIEVGLLARPEEDHRSSYDRFRHRITFPIQDRRGRVVGFGGRALGEARAKYLNTPETPLFHKGELLYGLSLARQAARARGTVIVAEGYMDVIALAAAGFTNAVAPLGTAISEAQLGLLWQLADEPVVCLDSDEAGLRAGHRLIERALPLLRPGKSLRFALMPRGADPDDVRRRFGNESLARRLDDAKPLIDFLWESETRGRPLDTPERRAALRKHLLELAGAITDRELRRLFRGALIERLGRQFGAQRRRPGTTPPPNSGAGVGAARLGAGLANREAAVERDLIGPVVVHPELLDDIEEEFARLDFTDPRLAALQGTILSWYGTRGHLDPSGLKAHLSEVGFANLVEELSERGAALPWYCQRDAAPEGVLEGWRSRVARHRRFLERRAVAQAAAVAIAEQRADAGAHVTAVSRLINRGTDGDPSTGSDRQ